MLSVVGNYRELQPKTQNAALEEGRIKTKKDWWYNAVKFSKLKLFLAVISWIKDLHLKLTKKLVKYCM